MIDGAATDPATEPGAPAPTGFGRYWAADAISAFGTAVTSVAMPVLVVRRFDASPLEVGAVNAAQLVPYAVLGLVAGAYVDRWPRRRVLVWSSIGRGVVLGLVPVLALLGVLTPWVLVVVLLAFGSFSVFGFAATQSLLPRLVPRHRLVVANARLDQTSAAAQTAGPALGGALVGLLGAPVAIVVDAVSFLVEAALVATLPGDEPRRERVARSLRSEVGEGLRWTYRHPVLGRLALSTHVWFLANGAAMTTLSLLALRTLDLSAGAFGLLLTGLGVAGLLGAVVAPWVGSHAGEGRAVVLARAAYPVAWLLPLLAGPGPAGVAALAVSVVLLGLATGVESSNEMGLWQTMTPDGLLGRVNGTRRSVNRTLGAAGAVLGGLLVGSVGTRDSLVAVVVVFAVAALVAAGRAVRTSTVGEPGQV